MEQDFEQDANGTFNIINNLNELFPLMILGSQHLLKSNAEKMRVIPDTSYESPAWMKSFLIVSELHYLL